MDPVKPSSILIVKTSSLGDILQSFDALSFLRDLCPEARIDWVVEKKFCEVVKTHPLIDRVFILDRLHWIASIREIRTQNYDVLIDLQGNCKSGVVTWFAKARIKIGFGMKSLSEWPNALATHVRFDIDQSQNIRLQSIELIAKYFQVSFLSYKRRDIALLQMNEVEKRMSEALLPSSKPFCMMICLGSNWENKRLSKEVLIHFLKKVCHLIDPILFVFVWGNQQEKETCEAIQTIFFQNSIIFPRLSIPAWQNIMDTMNLIFALDSSALHLAGTTKTPSFSVFGPTQSSIFKPEGDQHKSIQGACPYHVSFHKRCPFLRTCKTGACIKSISADSLFEAFLQQYRNLL